MARNTKSILQMVWEDLEQIGTEWERRGNKKTHRLVNTWRWWFLVATRDRFQ